MNLIRDIFLAMEAGNIGTLEIDERDGQTVAYHVRSLIEAGFISGDYGRDSSGIYASASHLTWAGHDFLDAARDQNRWNKAQEIIGDKGGSITFEVLKQLLTSLMQQALGLG